MDNLIKIQTFETTQKYQGNVFENTNFIMKYRPMDFFRGGGNI